MSSFAKIFLATLAFVAPLALYIRTLAPTYIPIDSAEFALCMHFWGICHPPGFPLYVLLGKIFTAFWPFGSVIFKSNLLSAIFGAGTIFIVYLSLSNLKVNRVIAILISLILAVSNTFWEFSVSADVFTFATFLTALTFYLVVKKRFYLAVFALGLSASHFYISAVLWPFLAWYFLADTSHMSYKSYMSNTTKAALLLLLSGVFLLGFFPQALMFWRIQQEPVINWGHAQGLSGFIDFVRRKEFGNIFLLSNPALQFSLFKFAKHIWAFSQNFITAFGVVLPLLILPGILIGKLYQNRLYSLLLASFVILILVQLFLLSTIDPLDKSSPFQISKFYLSAYVPAVILIGVSLQKTVDKLFDRDIWYPSIFLGALLIIYLLANFKQADFSKNYISQNMVLDAIEQLPEESLAITVSHVFNFGAKYEQLVNGAFKDIQVLYFPNEKNRDNESYFPSLFSGEIDSDFVAKVSKERRLGNAEAYILETISKNLDKQIYILQGDFEEKFFGYLKPYIRPYGLWWRVEPNINESDSIETARRRLEQLRNGDIIFSDIHSKQQQTDLLRYAVSYHSTGILLASYGKYDEALQFLDRSASVGSGNENIKAEIGLINETKKLESQLDGFADKNDQESLEKLGNNLFVLTNYAKCEQVFKILVNLDSKKPENFNNLASCQASQGKVDEAKDNYQKALSIDPALEKAKKGLEALGEN